VGLPEKRQAIKLALEPSPYPGDISPEGRVSRRFIGWGRGSLNLLLFLLYLSLLCIHLHGAGGYPETMSVRLVEEDIFKIQCGP